MPSIVRSARILFSITALFSSALLFVVEPIVAKTLLPVLGGSPSVWNACMLFFQAALLCGYAYAHAATQRLSVRAQVALHLVVLIAPLAVLPLRFPDALPSADTAPLAWLLGVLCASIGLPFFAVTTTSPLLQRWFAETADPSSSDPYFLYAAGNVGSVLALVGYPFLVERLLSLESQRKLWSSAYVALALAVLACGAVLLASAAKGGGIPAADRKPRPLDQGTRLRWVLLAFIPSSMMLGTTQYLTTDIAAIPLLWILPLLVYLTSFVFTFGRTEAVSVALAAKLYPTVAVAVAATVFFDVLDSGVPLILLHLALLFLGAILCHGLLAKERPDRARLTAFYLCLGAGGVLGGVFNSLFAPIAFRSLLEYPVAIVLAAAGRPIERPPDLVRDAAFVGVMCLLSVVLVPRMPLLGAALASAVCFLAQGRRLRFAVCLSVLFAAALTKTNPGETELLALRTFFGVYRVTHDERAGFNELRHGTTLHGIQKVGEGEGVPRLYYHPSGPAGAVFAAFGARGRARAGIVGLGVGSLAAYGGPDQEITFYEIDPAILAIAKDSGAFTFLRRARAHLGYVIGDARQTIAGAEAASYDLIAVDAFVSDAIPVHLFTQEALALYLEKLAPDGVLVFHLSNRYLDLVPIAGALARSLGLVAYVNIEKSFELTQEQIEEGKVASTWVALSRREESLAEIRARDPRWHPFTVREDVPLWRDDWTDLVWALRLRPY